MTLRQRITWLAARLLQYVFAVFLCQTAVGALVVVGWVSRRIQRDVLYRLWRDSPARNEEFTFSDFLDSCDRELTADPPHLIRGESAACKKTVGRLRRLVVRWFGGVWVNFKRGCQTSFNILLCLLPAELLWLFSWTLGWNISFFKVYEQSQLGGALGLFGLLLFVIAMLYIPLAHVRQSVTGDWRSWYAWRKNWKLVRRGMVRAVPLAGCFAVASLAVLVFRVAPYFLGNQIDFAEMDAASLREWLSRYYLIVGAFLVPLYMIVWHVAARIYVGLILTPNGESFTSDYERRAMSELGYTLCGIDMRRSLPQRFAWGGLYAIPLFIGAVVTPLLWLAVGVEIYVGQFFNYIPVLGWLNQPMILLPWIKYIPPSLS